MPGTVYRFKAFTVDTSAHTLIRDGLRISIQEQPFQVLLALLATPGKVVTRETLRTRLWGTDTFVDFDQSLNSAVRRLRLALQDNSREPIYIETLPRVGFRLLPEVVADLHQEQEHQERHREPSIPAVPVPAISPAATRRMDPPGTEPDLHEGSVARVRTTRVVAASVLTLCVGLLLGAAPARWRAYRHPVAATRNHQILTAAESLPAHNDPTADHDMGPGSDLTAAREGAPPLQAEDGTTLQELQGWYHLRQRTQGDLLAARQAFALTTSRRPADASAQVGLAEADILLALNGDAPQRRVQQAKAAGQRALALAPHLASAHMVLGAADALSDWDTAEAGQEFRTALHLDPHNSLSHLWYAVFVWLPRADYRAAEAEAKLAIHEDPLSLIAHTDLGWILYSAGKRQAALDQYRFVLGLDPGFVPAQFRLRQAAAEGGDAGLEKLVSRQQARISEAALTIATPATDDPACGDPTYQRPNLRAVETAVAAHCPSAFFFGQDPALASLRDDPAFAALLRTAHPSVVRH